jgi:hypothetical protein
MLQLRRRDLITHAMTRFLRFLRGITAGLILVLCHAPWRADAELPAWVVAEKEPLQMKRAPLPPYLEMTQSATIVRPKALTLAE